MRESCAFLWNVMACFMSGIIGNGSAIYRICHSLLLAFHDRSEEGGGVFGGND